MTFYSVNFSFFLILQNDLVHVISCFCAENGIFSRKGLTTGQISFLSGHGTIKRRSWGYFCYFFPEWVILSKKSGKKLESGINFYAIFLHKIDHKNLKINKKVPKLSVFKLSEFSRVSNSRFSFAMKKTFSMKKVNFFIDMIFRYFSVFSGVLKLKIKYSRVWSEYI